MRLVIVIRELVDSLCRDGADMSITNETAPNSQMLQL